MGRGFKQWTGNDSKALMKVYLPAIAGHVPDQMVRALHHFLEFCYLVRKACIDDDDLTAIAVAHYHQERTIFDCVRLEGYSLPRQHSMVHYAELIREFGAPNGLCSSITESKHIKAVKEPYRRSSKFEALGQMLITNQRLDKLAAARVDFKARGMLNDPLSSRSEAPPEPPPVDPEEIDAEDVDGEVEGEVLLSQRPVRNIPLDVNGVSVYLGIPHLLPLVRRFLYEQRNLDLDIDLDQVALEDCPTFSGTIRVHPSATSTFYATSDKSGTQGMRRERIRAVSEWRGGPARRDCVFVERDAQKPGFQGLFVARVHSFLSIQPKKRKKSGIPCALVSWFSTVGTVPCPATGMWIVEPDFDNTGGRAMSIIHLDTIYQGAHLLGRFKDSSFLPHDFTLHDTLDSFQAFYVNKYIDHHAYEIAF